MSHPCVESPPRPIVAVAVALIALTIPLGVKLGLSLANPAADPEAVRTPVSVATKDDGPVPQVIYTASLDPGPPPPVTRHADPAIEEQPATPPTVLARPDPVFVQPVDPVIGAAASAAPVLGLAAAQPAPSSGR